MLLSCCLRYGDNCEQGRLLVSLLPFSPLPRPPFCPRTLIPPDFGPAGHEMCHLHSWAALPGFTLLVLENQ